MTTKRTVRGLMAAGITFFILASAPAPGQAAEPPKAARSVHLGYALPPDAGKGVVEFYNEVVVRQVVMGSYFEACGFSGGYFGIQQREDKKVGIFSVWDTGKEVQKPSEAAAENRVKTLFVGDGVRASRFGGEGTGGHSDFDCDWVVGRTYQFDLRATATGNTTVYDAWFNDPDSKKGWMHVATFSAPDGGKKMTGLYSFIEDFRRDTQSATETRRAEYGNGWVKATSDGPWMPLTKATFTASGATWEAKDTIDAGVIGDHFYLQTGGDTHMSRPLYSKFDRPAAADAKPPVVPVNITAR